MKKTLALLALSVFLFASCSKDDVDELPPATQTGANTFGAKLDGGLWVPRQFSLGTGTILEARLNGTNGFFINARDFSSSPTEKEFEIYIASMTGPGTYLLNQNTSRFPYQSASYGYYLIRKFMPLNEWLTSSQFTGRVDITKFDQAAKIVSGTFEFTAGSVDSTASPITVSEGRFDVIYQ
ncbi:MAG TPA: DUF6252 family protein [Flavisolibacter sp.]